MADEQKDRRRPSATERRAAQRTRRPGENPFQTRTAAQRRAERSVITRGGAVTSVDGAAPVVSDRASAAQANTQHLEAERIAYLLEHPTKPVTEAELRAEYGYVLADVRNMFVLAGALVVVLLGLALLLPR